MFLLDARSIRASVRSFARSLVPSLASSSRHSNQFTYWLLLLELNPYVALSWPPPTRLLAGGRIGASAFEDNLNSFTD